MSEQDNLERYNEERRDDAERQEHEAMSDKPKIGDTVLLRGKILEDIGNTYTIGWSGANFSPLVPDTAIVACGECNVSDAVRTINSILASGPVVPVPAIVEVDGLREHVFLYDSSLRVRCKCGWEHDTPVGQGLAWTFWSTHFVEVCNR